MKMNLSPVCLKGTDGTEQADYIVCVIRVFLMKILEVTGELNYKKLAVPRVDIVSVTD